MYTPVYLCMSLYTPVNHSPPSIPLYTLVCPWIPFYTPVYPCKYVISITLRWMDFKKRLTLRGAFDLTSGTYKPFYKSFMKPNNKLPYDGPSTEQPPPQLLKNIPENINKRLSSISYSFWQKSSTKRCPRTKKALNESGYTYKLKYNPQPIQTSRRNRKRNRKKKHHLVQSPRTPAWKPT